MTRVTTILTVAIHVEDESPVFGENTVHVSLEDLGAGRFISIKQLGGGELEPGVVFLDFEEFDRINEAIETLKGQPGVQEPPIKAGGTM